MLVSVHVLIRSPERSWGPVITGSCLMVHLYFYRKTDFWRSDYQGLNSEKLSFIWRIISNELYSYRVSTTNLVYCFLFILQISEVVNSMKDLIDYSRETRTGPMGKSIIYLFISHF